jgi:hypothetical protein
MTALSTMRRVGVAILSGNAAPTLDRQQFTASGTWNRPTAPAGTTYTWAAIRVLGGGPGAGSGRKGAAGSARSGGNAGIGGYYNEALIPFASLPTSLTITVGAGGTGGAAQTTNSTNGNPGTDGGESSVVGTGVNVRASGGLAGLGGTAAAVAFGSHAAGTIGVRGNIIANTSVTAASSPSSPTSFPAGGGGGPGGGISTGNVAFAGCLSPIYTGTSATTPAGGVVDGASPVNPTAQPANVLIAGPGGSGGAASITTNAQAGGNGAGYGSSGGGGGAAVDSVGNSGAGGTGAGGFVEILCF